MLTNAQKTQLTHNLETIRRWWCTLPADVTIHGENTTTHTGRATTHVHSPAPLDVDAYDQAWTVYLAQPILRTTIEYWLTDQNGFKIPPELTEKCSDCNGIGCENCHEDGRQSLPDEQLSTVESRCTIAIYNIEILAKHPNIQRINDDLNRAANSLGDLYKNGRLQQKQPPAKTEPTIKQDPNHATKRIPNIPMTLTIEPTPSSQTCKECGVEYSVIGPNCDCQVVKEVHHDQ